MAKVLEKRDFSIDELFPEEKNRSLEGYTALSKLITDHLVEKFGIERKEAAEFAKEFVEDIKKSESVTTALRRLI